MSHDVSLSITAAVLNQILAAARQAGSYECVGLLATSAKCPARLVTAACVLPAKASGSHAEAEPAVLRDAANVLAARGLKPVGLWHSHGNFGVFHSGTDDDTALRLLPAMADWCFERPAHATAAPVVTEADVAVLPLRDGRLLRLTVLGPEIPGDELGRERLAWTRVQVTFFKDKQQIVQAVHEGDTLRLLAGGVCVTLGVPENATLVSVVDDLAPLRQAHLFSLVVNRRGEKYAEVVTVRDFDGAGQFSKSACEIVVVPDQRNGSNGVSELRMFGEDAAWLSISAEAGASSGQFAHFGEVTP